MNALVERLGWMLVHSVWEGAVIWLLLQVALILLHQRSAQSRYLAACLALGATAVLPWMTFGSMDLSARLRTAPVDSSSMLVDARQAVAPPPAIAENGAFTPSLGLSGSSEVSDSPSSWRLPMNAFLPWLVGAWLLGVTIFACRLGLSWLAVRRLANLPLPALSARWRQRLAELQRVAGVSTIVRMGESARVAVPLVVGWLKPVILLPLGVLSRLPAEQVESILLHELAHIRRHDFLVNLLQSVVETLFFYHPAVRSINRRIRIERELVCDDLSVQWCQDPMAYAKALATFEEFRRESLALAATGEGDLFPRIRRIVLGIEPRQHAASLFAIAGLVAMAVYLASMFFVPLLAAELMTDQERVAKIGSLQPPPLPSYSYSPGEFVSVSGTLKTEDGQPLPKSLFFDRWRQLLNQSEALLTGADGALSGGITMQDPRSSGFYGNTRTGKIGISVWAEGYAPCRKTIEQDHGGSLTIDLVLRCGFPGKVRFTDINGQPVGGVTLVAASSQASNYSREVSRSSVQTDADGVAIFGNVEADSPIHLNAIKPGWQMVNQIVTNWSSQTPTPCVLQPARPTSGTVIDQVTRKPVADAKIILAARRGTGDSYITFDPSNGQALGQSDREGRFKLESLAETPGYYVYVVADGYPAQSFPIDYGQQNRMCELLPGFRVRGKIFDPKGMLASKNTIIQSRWR